MQGKNLKCIFENTNSQQQKTDGRKFHHLGIMGAKPHNLCNRSKTRRCATEKGKVNLKQ